MRFEAIQPHIAGFLFAIYRRFADLDFGIDLEYVGSIKRALAGLYGRGVFRETGEKGLYGQDFRGGNAHQGLRPSPRGLPLSLFHNRLTLGNARSPSLRSGSLLISSLLFSG